MKIRMFAGALAMTLSSCSGITPGPTPTPVSPAPTVPGPVEPPYVKAACAVAEWALPAVQLYIGQLPPQVDAAVKVVEAGLPACAAGNASAAIVDEVNAIVAYLGRKGRHPPPPVAAQLARIRR